MPEPESNLRVSWDAVQKMVTDWSEKTFPKSTPKSILAHLKKEVKELSDAVLWKKGSTGEEAADCVLLLMHLCRKGGISLYAEVEKKFAKNQKRTWGKPNKQGFQEHI